MQAHALFVMVIIYPLVEHYVEYSPIGGLELQSRKHVGSANQPIIRHKVEPGDGLLQV